MDCLNISVFRCAHARTGVIKPPSLPFQEVLTHDLTVARRRMKPAVVVSPPSVPRTKIGSVESASDASLAFVVVEVRLRGSIEAAVLSKLQR